MIEGLANFILVLGQSNAMNWNTIGVPYPGGWTSPSLPPGVPEVVWNVINQAWEVYTPGINSESVPSGSSAWGPEASYSIERRSLVPQRCTYIVKYAVGGTGLNTDLTPNVLDWSPYSSGELFTLAMDEVDKARASLFSLTNKFSTIDATLWIGNESDTQTSSQGLNMMRDLPAFFNAIRTRQSAFNMKGIIARTNPNMSGLGSYITDVRDAQDYCGMLPLNATINTDDLTHTAGHYDPASVVTIGQRMAAAAVALGA